MTGSRVQVKNLEQDDVVDKHIHLYAVAILLSLAKLSFTWMNLQDHNILNIEQSNIIFLIEIISIPLSVINPTAWFAIFMTALASMCASTGYPTFAVLSAALLFVTLYIHELFKFREANKKIPSVFSVDVKPLIDEKILAQMA